MTGHAIRGSRGRVLAGSVLALALAPAATPAGTVTVSIQERSVLASAATPGAVDDVREEFSLEPGPFNETVEAQVATEESAARARASLNAVLGPEDISFTGSLGYEAREQRVEGGFPLIGTVGTAKATVGLVFSIDAPAAFTLSFDVDAADPEPNTFVEESNSFGGGLFPPLPGEVTSGTLQPGTYDLHFSRSVNNGAAETDANGRTYEENYRVLLDLTFADDPGGGGGGEPNPIPLPPAVWSGLAVLGAVAVSRLRKRRNA